MIFLRNFGCATGFRSYPVGNLIDAMLPAGFRPLGNLLPRPGNTWVMFLQPGKAQDDGSLRGLENKLVNGISVKGSGAKSQVLSGKLNSARAWGRLSRAATAK